jgi:hypothetical protein
MKGLRQVWQTSIVKILIMDTTSLMLSFFFGVFGLAYFVYGKKQANWVAMLCGAGLCLFPYVVSSILWMVMIGIALLVLPFVFRDY